MKTPPHTTHEDTPPPEPQDAEPDMEIMTALAVFPPQTLISEYKLTQMAGRHVTSVKRAIQRANHSPATTHWGQRLTVAAILEHSMPVWADGWPPRRLPAVSNLRPGQGGHN
jgi:hypothetical protein